MLLFTITSYLKTSNFKKAPTISFFSVVYSGQWSTGQPVPGGTLAEDADLTAPHIVADKADLFLAFSTVPGYRYFSKGRN